MIHMTKIALKVAYDGAGFSGSQIQVRERTVEGEMLRALTELDLIDDAASADVSSSGRTDAGVHSTGQVITFNTNNPQLAIPRVINSRLPRDMWAWAYAVVPDDFDCRRNAIGRRYRYYLAGENYDISLIREAAKLFLGEHDFYNFAKKDPKKEQTTVRTVSRLDIRVSGNLIRIDIEANAYLWHMIRKIVRALILIGNGLRPIEWIGDMLRPDTFEEGIEPAPAYGLTYLEVLYGDKTPEWIEDGYAIKKADEFYENEANRYKVLSAIMEGFVNEAGSPERSDEA